MEEGKLKKRAKQILNLISSEKAVKELIRSAVISIRKEDLINCIENDLDPYDLIFNHFSKYLQNDYIQLVVKAGFRKYWKWIEYYICDPKNLYELLSQNPELKDILNTKKAINWLNKACKSAYFKLYKFTWS